ncbi:alpha/beta hydrolase [Pusillimonas sp. T2]|nr:alpha/beta hydrolase [Pusillimonas sp. T2]
MLHGSGPGASSLGNWRPVLPGLTETFEVYAMDLVGFGQSDRKPAAPYFDYNLWVRQAQAMLNRIPNEKVGVIGHSLSASLALTLASLSSKVASVMTTGAMGAPFQMNEGVRRTWTCPRNREELVAALSRLIHDTSGIDEAYLETREKVIYAPGYADYFDSMFEGEQQRYIDASVLSGETLNKVSCPVLMLHGRNDGAFPPSCSEQISAKLSNADLVLLSQCSHSVAVERTPTFLALAREFFNRTL